MTILAAISLAAPAFVLGIGLIVLPITAHLLNRKARRRVTFPSIELLVSASASQSSLFKLRRWWLLLLRCLVVLAIVLAFMQPIWLSAEARQAMHDGAAVVLVVDTSASTGQLVNGIPAFQTIRAEADRVLKSLTPGKDHANIVYAAARPYSAFASLTTNTQALRSELVTLEPTYERADFVGSLSLAGRMLSEHAGPHRLVIVSDMQANNWQEVIDGLRGDMWVPDDTRIAVIPLKGSAPTNLSLHRPSVHPVLPRTGQPFTLGVTLTNHSDHIQPATVRMSVGSQTVVSQSLTIEPRQQRDVIFNTTLDRPGEHRVTFSMTSDALAVDNQCFQVVRIVEQTPVTLITDDDTNQPGTAGYFMARALAPYNDQRDRYSVQLVRSADPLPLTINNAAPLFVSHAGPLNEVQLAELLRYIEQGGGVIFFCDAPSAAANLAALNHLKPDGVLPWHPAMLHEHRNTGEPMTINTGDWRSRLLARFDETARLSLGQVRFHQTWSGGEVDQNAHVLLQFADDSPALILCEVGAGKLMIANFSAAEQHSDLGKHGLFVALMQGLAESLQDTHRSNTDNPVGRAASFTTAVPINPQGHAPRVYRPDGRTSIDATLALGDQNPGIIINDPSESGFYTAQQGDTVLGTIAVNTDPRESDLRQLNVDKLIYTLQAHNATEAMVSDSALPLTHHEKNLWGWFLLTAFICLGFEMFLLGHWRR